MKLRVKATVKRVAWKEDISQTSYDVVSRTDEGYILQWGYNTPELWVPSSGSKTYQIQIEGADYEFKKVVPYSKGRGKKPEWVEEVEEMEPILARYVARLKKVARVLPTDDYIWHTYVSEEPMEIRSRRNQVIALEKGMAFGIRPSHSGKEIRLITEKLGPSIVFTIPMELKRNLIMHSDWSK